ncbi:hypothetical protein [Microbulbifer sediminum]|uniref:hypothetical protein n=1 Tax=Microbulbifer sediminum TaxID=2904250 RepID=UPI001F2586FA|nr:hypothetical protein [Microbulbifer sediminum]
METDLKTLLEGVVEDLIDARFQADVAAAELAQHYRANPDLRTFSIPSLNISSVDVDLRFVFSQAESSPVGGDNLSGVESVFEGLSGSVLRMRPVADAVRNRADRDKLKKNLEARFMRVAKSDRSSRIEDRQSVMRDQIKKALSAAKVKDLSATDLKTIDRIVAATDTKLTAAEPRKRVVRPRVQTAPEVLSELNPDAISRISFSVDLTAQRWQEIEEQEGESVQQLVDE